MAACGCASLALAADVAVTVAVNDSQIGDLGSLTVPRGKAVLTLPSADGKAVCIGFGHRGALCRWTTIPCAGPTGSDGRGGDRHEAIRSDRGEVPAPPGPVRHAATAKAALAKTARLAHGGLESPTYDKQAAWSRPFSHLPQ